MRTDKPIGLYVHIPFCKRKCNYCDFASFPSPSGDFRSFYVDRLCREIEEYAQYGITIDTVFFGGGTPSLLTRGEIEKISAAIRTAFDVRECKEITAEINPGALSEDSLVAFLEAGVNRFSIGVQSIHENELKKLGRIHSFDDFLTTYEMIGRYGVRNVSVDLMFGIPEQTKESFGRTLDEIIKLSPAHVSAYGLIVEDGTPFYKERTTLLLPSEDEEREMYFLAAEKLTAAEYSHYEISNFAKEGFSCRHNLKYWNLDEYIGVGLAAHSYFGGKRFSNPREPKLYLSGEREESISLSAEDAAFEYAMLRLRTALGIDLFEYAGRFGVDFSVGREEKLSFYEKHGFLRREGGRIFLTDEGFYVSNTILSDIL